MNLYAAVVTTPVTAVLTLTMTKYTTIIKMAARIYIFP